MARTIPLEAVLRHLPDQIGNEGSQRRLANRVGPGMDQLPTQLVRSALSVVDWWHHDDVPVGEIATYLAGRTLDLVTQVVKRSALSGAILEARCVEGSESNSNLTLYYVYSNTTLTVLLRTEYGAP